MTASDRKRLGEMLMDSNLIDGQQLATALERQQTTNERLGSALVELGFLSEPTLAVQLSKQTNVPCVNVDGATVPEEVLGAIPHWVATEKTMLPLRISHGALYVAVADPGEETTLRWARAASGLEIIPMVAPEFRLKRAIKGHYGVPE